ncbi:hypothetical protein [Flavimaricola marinus]|uniref:Uncharacterized protein n=1 Tax=Flavimaricola marinus TaxID=1819565 RepID=A0A238LJ22_9RHOB|nr:hypothetical protein [Flavimaricola marinus]SMY09651.1 hypothetical protein LOM8899_03823 [Flavimaricola marinus]
MRALSFGMMIAFGLGWLATVAAEAALPILLAEMPGVAGPAASTVLDWAGTQTLSAMALSAAAYLCYAGPGGRGWGALALLAILPLLALAVVQFDPRIVVRLQSAIGPLFDAVRAVQPNLRLGLFAGVSMVGASHLIAGGVWGPRAVALAVLASLVLLVIGPGTNGAVVLALPALVLLAQAAMRMAEHDHPAAPYILTGAACVITGVGLVIAGDSPRQDIRAGFVLLPLFAALAHRMRPRLPAAVLWLHALLIAAGLAYLAPGLAQFGDVRPATSFAEIAAVVRRAEALRTGVGLMLAFLALLGLVAFRLRRDRSAPPLPEARD